MSAIDCGHSGRAAVFDSPACACRARSTAARLAFVPFPADAAEGGLGADMSLILLLALPVAIVRQVPPDFDLAKYRPSASCESAGPYDVTVCSRRNGDRNRVLPIAGDFEIG